MQLLCYINLMKSYSKRFWHHILRDTLYNGYLQCARIIVSDVDSCRHEPISCRNFVWELDKIQTILNIYLDCTINRHISLLYTSRCIVYSHTKKP